METIKISKVKIIKKGEKLEIGFSESGGDIVAVNDKICDNVPHKDLRTAIAALTGHYGVLTDFLRDTDINNQDEREKFLVSGYSIGGKPDEPGITITGMRKTRLGKTLILNSPFIKLDTDSDTYTYIDDLNLKIKAIEKEALLYLEGKQEADNQLELPFETPEISGENTNEVLEAANLEFIKEVTKKPTRKRVAQSADAPGGEVEL